MCSPVDNKWVSSFSESFEKTHKLRNYYTFTEWFSQNRYRINIWLIYWIEHAKLKIEQVLGLVWEIKLSIITEYKYWL